MSGTCYLACEEANRALTGVPAGSIALASFSPRYLDLVDYTRAAAGAPMDAWRPTVLQPTANESVADYLAEHLETVGGLAHVCRPDAIIAVEIDHYRDLATQALVPLPDYWAQMLEAVEFRILERITLVRPLALGRRSGHFKRYGGRPGYALPDHVTSTLLIAGRGDPLGRLRRDGRDRPPLDVAWAERFLKDAWLLKPPRRRAHETAVGHPVPQDADVARAVCEFYSLPGDAVLDPFAGSGTTGRVAFERGRVPFLIEREPGFAQLIATTLTGLGARVAPLAAAPHPTIVTGAQFALEMGATVHAAARRAFLGGALGEVTTRHRAMAHRMTGEAGIQISPELVALFLRAERSHYTATRRRPRRTTPRAARRALAPA